MFEDELVGTIRNLQAQVAKLQEQLDVIAFWESTTTIHERLDSLEARVSELEAGLARPLA